MAELKGTNIAAPVVPFADTDSYATHDETYGRGGYRSVADIDERDAIPFQRRKAGMLVHVLSEKVTYELGEDLESWTAHASGGGSDIGDVTAEAVALASDSAPAVQVERTEADGKVNLHFVFGIPVPSGGDGHVEFSQSEVTLSPDGTPVELQILSNLEWTII